MAVLSSAPRNLSTKDLAAPLRNRSTADSRSDSASDSHLDSAYDSRPVSASAHRRGREYEESLATSETIDTKLRRLAPTFAQVSPRRRLIALVVFSLLAMAAAVGIGLVVRWVRLRNAEQGAVRTVPQARGGASDHRVVAARGPG